MVRLVPMTPEDLRGFLATSIPSYAQDHVAAGRWKAEDAVERSREEHEKLLPRGVETPDTYLFTAQDEATGERVGEVWYVLQRQEGPPQVFVYWIGIAPPHRRKGYATQIFQRVESDARRLGATRVALHVFGENLEARALYEKLGYQATNIIMSKAVPA